MPIYFSIISATKLCRCAFNVCEGKGHRDGFIVPFFSTIVKALYLLPDVDDSLHYIFK